MPLALPALLALLLLAESATAQDPAYGKNKVQVRKEEWVVVRTGHFEIHFDRRSAYLGEYAAFHLERMYDSIAARLNYGFRGRVPIVLYASPGEFQNTNIIPILLPENVGGFTEVFRNRVVIPFDGSYPRFHHVLQHELVHAFMFEMFGDRRGGMSILQGGTPLWFSEGLAEYLSVGWDLESDMYMADAVTSGYVRNPANGLPGFMAYKGGQNFYAYLVHAFGPAVIPNLATAVRSAGDLFEAFQAVTGARLEEVGELWLRETRSIYWPELAKRRTPLVLARQLTDHEEEGASFNAQPALSPDGKTLAFFSDREAYVSLYLMDVSTGRIIRDLARSGAERGHLSFYPQESRIAWSPDGKRIAFVSKTVGRDVLTLVDVDGIGSETVEPPDLTGLVSPAWSPDGGRIAFSGIQNGLSDLYVWNLEAKKLTRLTHDIARDGNPAFSPSGGWIAFESDRTRPVMPWNPEDPFAGRESLSRYSDIYAIPAAGGEPVLIVGGEYDETWPSYGPGDSLIGFVSNRSGLPNAYISSLGAQGWSARPITNLLTAVSSPSWSGDGARMAFSLFHNGGWDIYMINAPLLSRLQEPLPLTVFMQTLEYPGQRYFGPFPPLRNLTSFQEGDHADSLSRYRLRALSGSETPPPAPEPLAQAPATEAPPPDSLLLPVPAPTLPVPPAGTADAADTAADIAGAVAADTTDFLTARREFPVEEYGLDWGVEAARVDIGFNTLSQSTAGLGFITLADMLGNHRFSFTLGAGGESIRDVDAIGIYQYLPRRTDYQALAYHLSNFSVADGRLVLDRQYGGGLAASYPLSIFTRLELDGEIQGLARGYWSDIVEGTGEYPFTDVLMVRPRLAWVNDNSLFSHIGPAVGRRLYADFSYVPPVLQDTFSFVQAEVDLRKYWLFDKTVTLAARVTAGLSESVEGYANPHSYRAGGDALIPLFYFRAEQENVPRGIYERSFTELALPVRGFPYYAWAGNRKFIGNLELRFPFITDFRMAYPIPLRLRALMGTVFVDYGGAWQSGDPWYDVDFDEVLGDLGLGYGFGVRANLGIFVLRYTRAYNREDLGPGDGEARNYWSAGAVF